LLLRFVPVIYAFVSGVSMAVQGSLNSALGKIIGLWEATFVVHASAAAALAVLVFGLGIGHGSLGRYSQVPWYLYLGGALGILITFGVVSSIPKLGVANATTFIIVGQVGFAALIDHLGLFGLKQVEFNYYKLVGILFLGVGAWFLLRR